MLTNTCELTARGQGVKLGYSVNNLLSVQHPSACSVTALFCLVILEEGIDPRGGGVYRGRIDVQHILKPTQLKNKGRKCLQLVVTFTC